MKATSTRNHILIIVAVALILRLALLGYISLIERQPLASGGGGDAAGYMEMARHVYQTGSISSTQFLPRPPLFPALAGTIYHVTGENPFTIVVLNLLMNVLTCVLVYQLALTIGQKPRTALIAGLMAAVYPAMLVSSVGFMTEALALLFYTLAILLFARFINNPNWRDLVLTAAVLACSTLTRLTTLFLPVLLIVMMVRIGRKWQQYIAVLLIISIIPGVILIYRNWYYAGIATFSTQTQWMLLFMRGTSSERRVTGEDANIIYARYIQEIEKRLGNPVPPLDSISDQALWDYFEPSSPEMQTIISQLAIEKTLAYPQWYILNTFYGLHRILSISPIPSWLSTILIPIHYLFVLLACLGFWYYVKHQWRWAWLMGISALWVIGLTLALETAVVNTRHGVGAALTMFVLASQGIEYAIARWQAFRLTRRQKSSEALVIN